MGRAADGLPHCNFFFSPLDDATLARWNLFDLAHQRFRIAAPIEAFGRFARRIVKFRPGVFPPLYLIRDRHSGRGPVADAPGVGSGRDVKTWRFRANHARVGNAIRRVVILVDPSPRGLAWRDVVANPLYT